MRSVHRQELYTWPGGQALVESFSSVDGIPPMARIPPQTYYTRFGIYRDQQLEIPENFTDLLKLFHQLPFTERERFLRASYWFQHAQGVWNRSASAAFVAFISSVETLMPKAPTRSRCPTCEQLVGPGPTAQFKAFVDRLAPDSSVPPADRRRFYSLRSALSHGGRLLHSDQATLGMGPLGMNDASELGSRDGRVATEFSNLGN